MAKPPEPLAEVLPLAGLIVEAIVAQVLSTGPRPAQPERTHPPGRLVVDTGALSPPQALVLDVMRVLRGSHAPTSITVEKPPAGYSLLPGNRGAFLLDTRTSPPTILGRYGPDTWPLSRVEKAVQEL